jgi:hypothetical protein
MVPFLAVDVHLKSVYWLPSFQIILLGQVLLPNLAIMLSDLSEKRSAHFRTLSLQQLHSFTPLFRRNRSLNRLLKSPSLDIMVHSIFCLFHRHQPIPPSFFQIHHQFRFGSLGQIHCLAKGKPFTVTIKRFLQHLHLLIEFPRFFIHA